jgi:hypothetical protein
VGEHCIERTPVAPSFTHIPASDQHSAVHKWEKAIRLGASNEVAANCAPTIAPHSIGAPMLAADSEWHSGRQDSVKVRVEKVIEGGQGHLRKRIIKMLHKGGIGVG